MIKRRYRLAYEKYISSKSNKPINRVNDLKLFKRPNDSKRSLLSTITKVNDVKVIKVTGASLVVA